MRQAATEIGSLHSLHDHHDPPLPTPPDVKKAATVKRLSYIFGFLYSMFLIILAGTILVKTALINDPWTPIITIYVTVTGLIVLCVLIVDVKLFTRRIRKQVETLRSKEESGYLRAETTVIKLLREKCCNTDSYYAQEELIFNRRNNDKNTFLRGDPGDVNIATSDKKKLIDPVTSYVLNNQMEFNDKACDEEFNPIVGLNRNTTPHEKIELDKIEHSYCFSRERHMGSVYLKFGAAAFALGHFVHTVLLVVTVHWSIAVNNAHCINVLEYVAALLQCLYCLVQLFFVFTYSNLIIVRHTTIARLAFLHMMAGNICLWISAVSTETNLAYKAYNWLQKEINKTNTSGTYTRPSPHQESCTPTAFVAKIFDNYSAYLYPFTVEFNILVVGIWFMIWRQIGKCRHSSEEVQHYHHSLYAQTNINDEVNSPHGLEIHIRCRNAACGLFSSLFVIVILIVTIILEFMLGNFDNEDVQNAGRLFGQSMKLVFHTAMLIASAAAFRRTHSLDINRHPVPWLDDVLLYICVPAFFLESILTVVPTITTQNIVEFLNTIMMSLQMMVQIAFIIDGLRRCANSRKLRRTKPGRDVILFLLVTNVSLWVMYTFSYQSPDSKDVRYVYYGKEMWLAIGHICTPLIMFFRFHSSVCIADIWVYAYKPGIEDH